MVDDFLSGLKGIIDEKTKGVFDIYQVVSYNETDGKITAKKIYEKTNSFKIINSGIGLGDGRGIVAGYKPGDILLCLNLKGQTFIITTLHNTFFPDKDEKLIPKSGEIIIAADSIKLESDPTILHLGKSSSNEDVDVGYPGVSISWDEQKLTNENYFSHSVTTNNSKITIKKSGYYKITCNVGIDNTGAGRWSGAAYLTINGTDITETHGYYYSRGSAYGDKGNLRIETIQKLDTEDEIEIFGFYNDHDQNAPCNTRNNYSELIVTKW